VIVRERSSASIQRQLQLFFVGLLAFTVIVMGSAWFIYNQGLLKDEAERVLTAESDIIGSAVRPALMFNDKRLAAELLQSMKLDSDITMVKLFTIDGKVLGTYSLQGDATRQTEEIPFRKNSASEFSDGKLRLYRVVTQKQSPVGMVVVESGLVHLRSSLQSSVIAMLIAILACLFFGALIARRLQHKIVAPIASLASLMRRMGDRGDYSLRMESGESNSEMEELIVRFNQMAGQIQSNFDTIEMQQEDLRKREKRFRNIVEVAPLPVLITRQ